MSAALARSLPLEGGGALALRVYEPSGEARATVVIGGAMGVPQDYYAPYASWLAAQGYRVWSFDYRGHGESLPHTPGHSLRGFKADLFDWARDYETVVLTARRELPARPLYLLGHSLGAQLPGLFRHPDQVDGLFSIAAGSGYWRENAPQLRRRVLFFWHVMVPLATRVCGYFPGRRLGMVGNLPAGVIHQWRRWCMHPRYSAGAEGAEVAQRYACARFPVLAWSFSDDELMTLRGTHSLIKLYSAAPSQVLTLHPVEVPSRRIGHFGFFREAMRPTLWPRSLAALQSLAASGVPPGTQGVATPVHTMQP
ncbi:alpha/beta fold hydrolase [Rhodoferax sp. BAB1]|uniref:alpha/beta hydrolase family protein n=1 Tax=Rhodoferax sp. BAB1 TaxID=2741720 RepID=UPI001575B86D|nr:alpha/beta fold hydrolase [Rhodoferax sp. BAB1]QKO22958.1 alpha/beta fold hydrolase [Rhodoferax sp. BAB1]